MPIRVLKRGSKGPFVAEIQRKLNQLAGYDLALMGNGSSLYEPLVEDGHYGRKTAERVKEFQAWNPPLKNDGKVGPKTYAALTGKFWSPEQDKAAGAAAPPAAAPKPKVRGHLYVHAHDAPGKNRSGSAHAASMCHHVVIPQGQGRVELSGIKETIEEENLEIADLVLNSHGASAGQVKFGGATFELGTNAVGFFQHIKPALGPSGIVWIYACAFATHVGKTDSDDVWLVEPSEIRAGRGTQQMHAIARHLNRPVRAGFGMQFGDMAGFTTPWAEVRPNGDVALFTKGRTLSTTEWLGQKSNETSAFLKLLVTGHFL